MYCCDSGSGDSDVSALLFQNLALFLRFLLLNVFFCFNFFMFVIFVVVYPYSALTLFIG